MPAIRAGVIGVGHLGYHHARNYAALDGVELAGVVDTDEGRGRQAADDFGVPLFGCVADLVAAGVDAVSVAAPTTNHFGITMEALSAGIDVLVEKPIATSSAQACDMVALANANDRILQVGHIERFNGAVMALMGAVKNPRFIECHRLSPYPNRGQDVSVVLDLMIHDLDIVRALSGGEVESLDAAGVAAFSDEEDIANARIRFDTGCVVNLTSSRISMERMRKIRIFEADAYLSTDYTEQEVLVYRKKPGEMPEGVTPMQWISIDALPVLRDEPLKLELASFAESVRERRAPVVTGKDGLAALELAEAVIKSIRENP